MDVQLTWTDCDKAGDYVVPNVLSPRDLVSSPDNMDKTVLHTVHKYEKQLTCERAVIQKSLISNSSEFGDCVQMFGPHLQYSVGFFYQSALPYGDEKDKNFAPCVQKLPGKRIHGGPQWIDR